MSTLKNFTDRYYNELIPECNRIRKEADEKILAKNDEILGGLVEVIKNSIPNGKWKKLMEKTFSFIKPSETEIDKRKIVLWKLLEKRMTTIFGIPFIQFERTNVIDSGFSSWNEFLQCLSELKDATKDVFVLYDFSEDKREEDPVPDSQEILGLIFSITCIPKELAERQEKAIDEIP